GLTPGGAAPRDVARKHLGGIDKVTGKLRQRDGVARHPIEQLDPTSDCLPFAPVAECFIEAYETRSRTRPSKPQVELSHRLQPFDAVVALSTDEWMLEQGKQGHRRKFFCGGAGDA